MFCKNNSSQLNLNDPILKLPKYLREILDKSWAKPFHENVFCKINEERFSVLYSTDNASRPNTPVNVLVGLLAIKEIFIQNDEELIGSLHFDTRYQYALGTTSFEKQPVSINTLTNFRRRLLEYEAQTGIDLLKEEIKSLSKNIGETMEIDNKLIRMDSLMISSSCKKLSRIELVYTVNFNIIKVINKVDSSKLSEELLEYLKKSHKNDTIYRTRNTETETKLDFLLKQSLELQTLCFEIGIDATNTNAFQNLERIIFEQINIVDDKVDSKSNTEISSDSLQNPSDPDATYRKKYGRNVGYVGNIVESIDEDNSIIVDYDLKPNIYSDSKFAEDAINELTKNKYIAGESKNKIQLLMDGAFYSQERADEAKKLGIDLVPTELVGRKPTNEKISYSEFIVDENTNLIIQCPNRQSPEESYFSKDSYIAKFNKETCSKCPLNSKCPFKSQKKFNDVRFSKKSYNTSCQRKKMSTEEYINLSNKRAGIEGIPSVLRRRYNVDHMPVRGLLRSKLCFGFKILAYNIKKLLKSKRNKGYSPIFICVITKILENFVNVLKFGLYKARFD